MLKRTKIKKNYFNAKSFVLTEDNIEKALCALAFGYDIVESTDTIKFALVDPKDEIDGPRKGILVENKTKTTTVGPNLQALSVAKAILDEMAGREKSTEYSVIDPFKEIADKMRPLLLPPDG